MGTALRINKEHWREWQGRLYQIQELFQYYYDRSYEIAKKFDLRNQTDYYQKNWNGLPDPEMEGRNRSYERTVIY